MKIPASLTQVIDGLEYEGKIQFEENEFTFNIQFGVNIQDLDNEPVPPSDQQELINAYAKRLFRVTLKKGEDSIELEKETFHFLLSTIVALAIQFYNLPQTRDSNEGFLKTVKTFADEFGVKGSIGMETVWNVPIENIPRQLLAA